MKRLIALLLATVFVWMAMPLDMAAAALNPPPTAQELSAAIALTGLSDDAPGYHPGMALSSKMNIQQLIGWIVDFAENRLACVMDTFENYDVEMHYLQDHDPVSYGLLSQVHKKGIDFFYYRYDEAMDIRDEITYYRDMLTKYASDVFTMAEALKKGGLTEKQQAVYAYEIRDGWRRLLELQDDVAGLATAWERQCIRMEQMSPESFESPDGPQSFNWLLDSIDALRGSGHASARTMTVPASAVRVETDRTVMTRLARLSPIGSALADADQKMSVMIMDDKSFAIGAMDGTTPVPGVTITVSSKDVQTQKRTTDDSGYISLPMRDYYSDKDGEMKVDLTARKDGYRNVDAPGVWVRKGDGFKVPMYKDNGDPYPVVWTFWGNDMTLADYELVLSPFNDSRQDISIRISSPKEYSLKMYFTDANGKKTLDVGTGSGKAGENSFTFNGQWLKQAPGGGKLVTEITPKGGSTVTYRAKLTLIAPKLAKPIGDPNFKLLMEPGLQFKLPKSWSKPFSDMTIAINTPLDDAFKVRAYYDLNGNGAVTIGTNAFDDRVKAMNEGMWKSQDKKDMDKAVKAAEEKGMMAKAKAQNGGDWAGRSKYNPLKLGKISVTMSWFAYVQGQYRETADNYGQILAKGGAGFTVTVKGEYGLQWPFASVTVHVALSGTIFPEIAVLIDTYWPEGQMLPSVKKIDYAKASLNYILRLEVGLTVTLGLKGVASISAIGLGFLEFHFRVSSGMDLDEWLRARAENRDTQQYHDGDIDLKLYGGMNFRIVVEILWSKTTYTPFGPEWRWKLLPPPVEKADTRKTPVERFLAYILSSASAEEAEAEPQGGLQVDTGNGDLVIKSQEIAYANTDAFGNTMFNMRTSGSGAPETVPMMLYIKNQFHDGNSIHFDRPGLIAVPLTGTLMYSPIAKTEEGLDAAGRGRFDDGGYDVIDFDYWVQDVSAADLSSWDGGAETKLNDVVFIVSILAKDYEQQTRTLDDGTTETRKVPLKTWAYVHTYYLAPSGKGYVLKPVVLTKGGKYLAEMYELQVHHDPYTNPCGDPRIFGNIMRTKKSAVTLFRIVTVPLNIIYDKEIRRQDCVQVLAGIEENGMAIRKIDMLGLTDRFFENSVYEDFCFFNELDNSKAYDQFITQQYIGYSATYYSMVRSLKEDTGLYSLGYDNANGGTEVYAENVVSFVNRGLGTDDPSRRMIFFVQKDGEDGFVLKGLLPAPTNQGKKWTEWNYGVSVPATTIRWTTLYGRECVYWAETAGETEDGKAQMFKVRGVWFDSASSTMSEPFTIAALQTPLNSSPAEIILAGNDSGCYILRHENGRRTAHRFNFQLVLGVRMVGSVLTETLAAPGTYDDVVLTLYNNGNVPLSKLDLSVYDQDENGRAEVFETIHLDVLNPQNNRVTLVKGQGLAEEKRGETVARQEECSLNGDDTHFWLVSETEYLFRKPTPRVLSENSGLRKTDLIMPGTFSAFNISLLMPQDWKDTHSIYLQVEKMYTTDSNSFSADANALTARGASDPAVISVSRNGEVRREGGGLLRSRGDGTEENDPGYASMFKTDLNFDRMRLNTDSNDVEIYSRRWDASDGTPMVTLTVYNKKYIAMENRRDNVLVMEAYLDDETAVPSFRYSFTEEVSNKETWNFDLPLSLLTGGKKASRVRVGISGKDYSENGVFDNTTVIYLDTEELSFPEQPADQSVLAGSGAVFRAAAAGGRTPYRYQWQERLPQGDWHDMPGETGDTLEVKAVTEDMNGNRYRLVLRDANDNSVRSREAVLTVRKVPHTGDSTPIGWYLAGIAAAVCLLGTLGLKRKKEQTR